MAKIIKEENFNGRCDKCGCYFEYEFEDLEDVLDTNGRVMHYSKHVKCPKCGNKVFNIWHNGQVKR